MISDRHKFIFIHVPRTGGTSIEQFLIENEGCRVSHKEKHKSMFSFKNRVDFSQYFKFSFIRNPWDITISKYLTPYYKKINYLGGKDLLYFLKNYYSAPHEAGDSFHDYFNPQQMDFIGRFEDREKDLDYISNKIKVDLDPSFSVKNKEIQKRKSEKHYTEYYNDETIQLVADKYKKDIEYFGYEFGE